MRAVELIREDVRPSQILTPAAFENALRVSLAVSGSTNLVLHFIAMAKEAGIELDFDFIDRIGRTTPDTGQAGPERPVGRHRARRRPAAYPPCSASSAT